MNRPVVVVPLLVVGGFVLVAIPAVIFSTGGGFSVPQSLGGGGDGGTDWLALGLLALLLIVPTYATVRFFREWMKPGSKR